MARILVVHGDVHYDMPVGEDVGWRPLLTVAGAEADFVEWLLTSPPVPTQDASRGLESSIVRFLVSERSNPSSILSSLAAARDDLRAAQPVVPGRAWQIGNELWLSLRPDAGDNGADGADPSRHASARHHRVEVLTAVIDGCQRLNGVLWGTMRRDEASAFLRIGQELERADLTARLLEARAASLLPGQDGPRGDDPYREVRFSAVLRSLAAEQSYRRVDPAGCDPSSLLRFVFQDSRFPRSVASCLTDVLDLVKGLPRNEAVVAACSDAAVLVADAPAVWPDADAVVGFCGAVERAVAVVHEEITTSYFGSGSPPPGEVRDARPGETRAGFAWSRPRTGKISAVGAARVYQVRHQTLYRYEEPADHSYNEAHLQPRDTDHQRCLSHRLEVRPDPSVWSGHRDHFGNAVTTFVVRGRFEALEVTSVSEVAVDRPSAPPESPSWEAAVRLLEVDRLPASREARPYRVPSKLAPWAGPIAEYAARSFPPGRSLVEAALDLTNRIHRDFRYDPGFTTVTTPITEVIEHRRGVCQDFAHLGISCLRSIGLAARYVSGYLETEPPAGSPKLVGADASHAWLAVFLPGWGWLDLDPTNDTPADDRYITVAWGRDYWDVSPVRGSVEGGGASHSLEVSVDVERLGPGAAPEGLPGVTRAS